MVTIDEIQAIAASRGGKCLSESFKGWKYKLEWQCFDGHIWEATLSNIKYGKWCPICGKKSRGMKRRDTIENMKKLAESKNGKCLSTEYLSSSKHLDWQCSEGHIWKASPDNIKAGKWCPTCGKTKAANKRRKTLKDMQELAAKNEGKCLSVEYINMNTKLEWECAEGHTWEALPSNISRGKWCPFCTGRYRTIEDMRKFAKSKGGKCLSISFKKMIDKLEWECSEGHIWESTPNSLINSNTWCPVCAGNLQKSIDYCKELASNKGGECLSQTYRGVDSTMLWKCSNGHKFKMSPFSVSKGAWCPLCNQNRNNLNEEKCRYILEAIFDVAFDKTRKVLKNGLELDGYNKSLKLAFEYNGIQHYQYNEYFHENEEDFRFQMIRDEKKKKLCHEKGIFLLIIPYTVASDSEKENFIIKELNNNGFSIGKPIINWSNFYKGYAPLKELIEIAKKNNGECLSLAYEGIDEKLVWRCELGHIWESSPYQIKGGSWCPQCSGRIKTIEDMQELAQSKGGKCLSDVYINNSTKIIWQCSEEHIWEASYAAVKRGTWCPICNGNKSYSIEDMHELADKRSGQCLSMEYINFNTKLKWKCKEGHVWEARPSSIVKGSWCKECLKPSIIDAKNLAEIYGGECLSSKYIDSISKLKWKCSDGHVWEDILGNIKRGRWCPTCKKLQKESEKYSKLNELKLIAIDRGGECLSEKYENVESKLIWRCERGHVWESSAYSIKTGAWCSKCAVKKNSDRLRGTIEEMHEIAHKKSGKCLSNSYINSQTPLEWECINGHRWYSSANSIKNGTWCPKCAIVQNANRQRKSIEDMKALASLKNGECLSQEYINAHTKLLWKCSEGHEWEAKPNNIQQGKWCPKCRGI